MKFMKRTKLFLVICIVLLLMAACNDNKPASKKNTVRGSESQDESILDRIEKDDKIIFGVKYDTRLFGLQNPKTKEIEGFEIDLAKEIAKGIVSDEGKVEFREVNTKTRIPLLQNEDIDLIIATMVITDERKEQIDFTDSYFEGGQSLLVEKTSEIKGVEDLENKKVITVKGATSGELIREEVPTANVLEFDNYNDAFSALKSGQGDVLTTDDAILYGLADENSNYHLVGDTLTEDNYGIGVKKGNEDLIEKINELLIEIKESGKYDEIYNKWITE